MKNLIKVLLIVILAIVMVGLNVTVNAADSAVSFTAAQEVEVGKTIVLKLTVTNSQGISGVQTKLNYNSEIFSLESIASADSKFAVIDGGTNEIALIPLTADAGNTAEINITLKALKAVATSTVSTDSIAVTTDETTNDTNTVAGKSVTITVIGEASKGETQKTDANKVSTENTINGNVSKNNTTASTSVPKTGLETFIVPVILVIAISLVVAYINYKKYKNV